MLKLKLTVLIGTFFIIHHHLPKKKILGQIVNKKNLQSLDMWKGLFFYEGGKTQILWTFEIGTQEGIKVPISILCRFPTK